MSIQMTIQMKHIKDIQYVPSHWELWLRLLRIPQTSPLLLGTGGPPPPASPGLGMALCLEANGR